MHRLSSQMRKGLSGILAAALIGSSMSMAVFADTKSLNAGTYDIDVELSSYVDAMGGIDFTKNTKVVKSASVTVDQNGDASLKLNTGLGNELTIYTIACKPFISGEHQPGYYADGEVQLIDESDYTVASYSNAKTDGSVVQTSYITSMKLPVTVGTSEYKLWYYVDSNVMGCQFCDGSGSAGSNVPDTATKYAAVLTLDWNSVKGNGTAAPDAGAAEEGTVYSADMELSCYVDAMGGIEFAGEHNLLQGNKIVMDEDGNYTATLKFGKTTGLNIYTVDCTAFIGEKEKPGYYDADGNVKTAQYTMSSDTVHSGSEEKEVKYVTSMTFPVNKEKSEYHLWLWLDSNVMGCQFGDGSGSAGSGTAGAKTKYAATLTIDWSTLKEGSSMSDSSAKKTSATVEYVVENCYEVEIPSKITVDSKTKEGKYTVNADAIPKNGYMIVTADAEGTLKNEYNDTVAFTNTLSQPADSDNEGTKLMEEGDTLEGLVKVTGKASSNGTYKGTINFTIDCY